MTNQNIGKTIDVILKLKDIIWAVATVVVIIFITLFTKYSGPIIENINSLALRASALEKRLDNHEVYSIRIEEKLDKVIWEIGELKKSCR